jgi:hypothetical protein
MRIRDCIPKAGKKKAKTKAVPQYAMKALGGERRYSS